MRILDASDVGGDSAAAENPFVGRYAEITCLEEALDEVKEGNTVTACVTGGSGSGKTALVQHFLELAGSNQDVLTFSGRCYEQESVPFNAFDEMVDTLAAHLARLESDELSELIDSSLVARLFPVLEPFFRLFGTESIESQELQQAAFAAFRTVLKRLSKRHCIIIHLDDLQWANADSLQLLTELLRKPGSPNILLILSFRPDFPEGLGAIDVEAAVHIQLE